MYLFAFIFCRRTLLSLLVLFPHMLSAAGVKIPKNIPQPPQHVNIDQEVLLLLAGATPENRTILTLNNNRDDLLTANITAYTLTGEAIPLPDVEMVNGESLQIELGGYLRKAGVHHTPLGFLKIHYVGVTLEMGAQLTLYPPGTGIGVDSPRSLAGDFKSTERAAVFWRPRLSIVRVALTNTSDSPIEATLKCGQLPRPIYISPKATAIEEVLPTDLLPNAGDVDSCDVTSNGNKSDLRVFGLIVPYTGRSVPIRFYDPSTATFSSLTSVGVRTGAEETLVVVHNTTDKEVSFTPIITEASLNPSIERSLQPITLKPFQNARVVIQQGLDTLRSSGKEVATLTLLTNAPKGAIIGALTQIEGDLVEDIPLRTSNPPATARGSYPLRWDEDYTNLVSVTNTSEKMLRISATITAKNMVYVIKLEDIAPRATAVFDVDQLKRDRVKDVNGAVLPEDATYGKFHWIEMGMGKNAGLLGRESLTSERNHRRSSFSCGSTCYYSYEAYPILDLLPFIQTKLGNEFTTQSWYVVRQTNGMNYQYPSSPSGFLGQLTDHFIFDMTFPSDSYGEYLDMKAIVTGQSSIGYSTTTDTPYYQPDQEACFDNWQNNYQDGGTDVSDETPVITSISPATWAPDSTQQVTFTGYNFGNNGPTLNFNPGDGIWATIISFSDTQIVANVTVSGLVQNEVVEVSVTSHGSNGQSFYPGTSGSSDTSGNATAQVLSGPSTPAATVIGWINGDVITLPDGASSLIVTGLNGSFTSCLATSVALGSGFYRLTSTDVMYANRYLVKHSANTDPGTNIGPSISGLSNYRLANQMTMGSLSDYSLGATPNPCNWLTSNPAPGLRAESYSGIGRGNTSNGKQYQLSEGRIGKEGQKISQGINGQRTVPWVWSAITYDPSTSSFDTGQRSMFPTFSIYSNGILQQVIPQSSIEDFMQNDQSYHLDPSNIH